MSVGVGVGVGVGVLNGKRDMEVGKCYQRHCGILGGKEREERTNPGR